MPWHVLTDGNLYWGRQWEVLNKSLRRPREAMGGLQAATLCFHPAEITSEQRRAWAILWVKIQPVPVKVVGVGKDARIVLV